MIRTLFVNTPSLFGVRGATALYCERSSATRRLSRIQLLSYITLSFKRMDLLIPNGERVVVGREEEREKEEKKEEL